MGIPMTQEGFDKIENELKECEERRPHATKAAGGAREKGDLKENAEYHAAREDLAMLEGRIRDLKSKVGMAEIVDKSKIGGDSIVFGATVVLKNLDDSEVEEYTLVGPGEDDIYANKILTTSPIGQALLTKKVGDEVEVPVPVGVLKFKVLEIRFE